MCEFWLKSFRWCLQNFLKKSEEQEEHEEQFEFCLFDLFFLFLVLFSRCLLFCFLAGFKSLYEFDGKLLKKVTFQTVRVHFLKKQKVNFGQLCEVDQCARSTVRVSQVCELTKCASW